MKTPVIYEFVLYVQVRTDYWLWVQMCCGLLNFLLITFKETNQYFSAEKQPGLMFAVSIVVSGKLTKHTFI